MGRRPTALFLIHDLGLAGAERSLIHLVNRARRIRPIVVVLRDRFTLRSEIDPGIPVFSLASPSLVPLPDEPAALPLGGASVGSTAATLARHVVRLRKLIRQTDCRIISTFLTKSHVTAVLARMLLAPRIPLVINVHESLEEHLRLHWPHPARRGVVRLLLALSYRQADAIAVVAEGLVPGLVRYGVAPQRIAAVANPLDIDRLQSLARRPVSHPAFSGRGPIVLGVGRLVPLKGFDVLIRAFARLPARLGARLAIVGDGPERAVLQGMIDELGIAAHATLLGAEENPWRYMARSDVVALPSLSEASPYVLAEALALGVPVIASDCSPGVRQYVGREERGLLVEPGNAAETAAALERLLDDPALRERLAAAGPPAAERFRIEGAVADYEALLERVLAGDLRRRSGF